MIVDSSDASPSKENLSHIQKEEALARFRAARIGDVLIVPLDMIKPSQKNDHTDNESLLPIEVYLHGNVFRIDTGNHRYYTRLKKGDKTSNVRKIEDPYKAW